MYSSIFKEFGCMIKITEWYNYVLFVRIWHCKKKINIIYKYISFITIDMTQVTNEKNHIYAVYIHIRQ
jgi:hypothetical protein